MPLYESAVRKARPAPDRQRNKQPADSVFDYYGVYGPMKKEQQPRQRL
jgi:hypothetical protein